MFAIVLRRKEFRRGVRKRKEGKQKQKDGEKTKQNDAEEDEKKRGEKWK